MLLTKAIILSLTLTVANGHMILKNSPSFGFIGNKLSTKTDVILNAPISKAQFPCKGYHKDPERGAGKSVATWAAGSAQTFSISGGTPHGGGSCQVSLSYDNDKTFKVIKSVIGKVPAPDRKYSFPITRDAASSAAIFA